MTGITGAVVTATRKQLKLSRQKFAEQVGVSPGALWRIEMRNVFKLNERELIETALNNLNVDITSAIITAPALTSITSHTSTTTKPTNDATSMIDVAVKTVVDAFSLPPSTSHTTVKQITRPEPHVVGLPELSPWQLFLQDGIRRYSNSEIQTFKNCPRKWYLAYYLRLQSKIVSPLGPRAIGDRIHRALRWHYHGDVTRRVDVRDALETIIKSDYERLCASYAPDIVPLAVNTKFKSEADLERVMVAGYVDWVSETDADGEYVITGSEQYLEVDLPTLDNVKIIARLDARVQRVSDGVRLFIDHKTVGSLDAPLRTLSLNEQMLWYMLVEQLYDKDTHVDGALYNMLRRVKRTSNAKPPFYKRVEVRHNPIEIKNFITKTTGVITNIERVRKSLDDGNDPRFVAYPTPNSSCAWACDFLALDTLMDDGSHWEPMAHAFFNVSDPTGYYVKDATTIPSD